MYVDTEVKSNNGKKNDINIEEMQKMIRQGATLVDVRSPQEYKEGHLKKSKFNTRV